MEKIKKEKSDLEQVGRKVVYTPSHGEKEEGVVTSWNERFIFVRYGTSQTSQATSRENLEVLF